MKKYIRATTEFDPEVPQGWEVQNTYDEWDEAYKYGLESIGNWATIMKYAPNIKIGGGVVIDDKVYVAIKKFHDNRDHRYYAVTCIWETPVWKPKGSNLKFYDEFKFDNNEFYDFNDALSFAESKIE